MADGGEERFTESAGTTAGTDALWSWAPGAPVHRLIAADGCADLMAR